MDNFNKVTFTKKADEVLEKLLSFFPAISRHYHQERLLQAIDYYVRAGNAEEVTEDFVIQAFEFLYPTHETLALTVKDPARLSAAISSQKAVDRARPAIHITRWPDAPQSLFPTKAEDVFALLAGPRTGGNTDSLMDAVLAGAQEQGSRIEKCCFSQHIIKPCTGCLACQTGTLGRYCSMKDDMEYIYKRFQECDAFVLGFPIYTGRESSHMTVFFDRLFALSDPWKKKQVKKRRGAVIATWGWPSPDMYASIIHNSAFILKHFGVETIEVVTGCGFWDAYYKKGSAGLVPEMLETARASGRALSRS